MYTFALAIRVLIALPLFVATAVAQNLVQNPDIATNTDQWITTASVEWSPVGRGAAGSVHLTSETTVSSASQCVTAEGGFAFVLSAHVTGHCPGARLYAIWADTPDCSDISSFPGNVAYSTLTDQWELLTVAVPARDDAYKTDVKLMDTGGCSGGYFFDDVTLVYDAIFADDFEGAHGIHMPSS